ncbi:MAG: ribosome maturation factor RimM, partial [Clostridia bacterium]
ALDGVSDVNAAMLLRNKVVFINKIGIALPDGQYFIADLIGLSVYSKDACIGKIKDVLTLPANDVYVVSGDDGEYMIPVVREFVHEIDMAARRVNVTIIPGMKGL